MSSLLSGSRSPTPAHPLAFLFCVTLCYIATHSLCGEPVQTLSPPHTPRHAGKCSLWILGGVFLDHKWSSAVYIASQN